MSRKFTIEFVRAEFEKEGYKLLTEKYIGASYKLDYICHEGHRHSIAWLSWQQGHRCGVCHIKRMKVITKDPEYIKKVSEGLKRKCSDPEYRKQMSEVAKKKWQEPGYREKMCVVAKKKWKDPVYIRNNAIAMKKHGRNPEFRKKRSRIMKKQWKDPEYQKMMARIWNRKPTRPEKIIIKLLNKLFPNEYKYVGDYKFFVNGKNPDFMSTNGQKKLIELYGDYWHQNDNPQDRIDYFKQFGFDTLVIWESELKNDIEVVKKHIKEFHMKGEGYEKVISC